MPAALDGQVPAAPEGAAIALLDDLPERPQIEALLTNASIAFLGTSFDRLIKGIGSGLWEAAIVSHDLLTPEREAALRRALAEQPLGADVPLLLLAGPDGQDFPNGPLGNSSIVGRPILDAHFLSAVRSAVSSRNRQRRIEAILADRGTESANSPAEEQLRESEELYRYTLELSQQIVWTAAADGTFLSMSDRFEEYTGLPWTTPPEEVVHPHDLQNLLDRWSTSLRLGRRHDVEFRMRRRDGLYRLFRCRAAPRRDESGAIVRWYGFAEDVHDQKESDRARFEAEERYRLATQATNDIIWDLNVQEDRVHWTGASIKYFGTAQDQCTPVSWWEGRLHPEDKAGVARSFQAALEGGGSHWNGSYRFRTADGEYAEIVDRGFIVRSPDGQAVRAVGAMADVTVRRRAEAELRRMQAELIHVSRLSAMETMASTLAHELNQPLTAIASYVRGSRRLLSNMGSAAGEQVEHALEAAESGALRAGQIVQRIRELVYKGAVTVKTEEIEEVVQDAGVLAFVDAHLMGVSHRVDIDPAAPWVLADRIQVQQVLINLTRNAIQSMQDCAVREVLISTRPTSDDWVEVSVADTGRGIPPEVRDALFSPFNSTKSDGMGIGLSISRTIIEAHGGKIWAEDRDGGGSIFRFTIPRAKGPSVEA